MNRKQKEIFMSSGRIVIFMDGFSKGFSTDTVLKVGSCFIAAIAGSSFFAGMYWVKKKKKMNNAENLDNAENQMDNAENLDNAEDQMDNAEK